LADSLPPTATETASRRALQPRAGGCAARTSTNPMPRLASGHRGRARLIATLLAIEIGSGSWHRSQSV